MPSKKGRPEPSWLVILEDIRSQNRSTLEAVEASRVAIDTRIDRFEQKTEARFTVVDAALQSNARGIVGLESALRRVDDESRSRDASLEMAIRELKVGVHQNSVDIKELTGNVAALARLEDRVSALERRGS